MNGFISNICAINFPYNSCRTFCRCVSEFFHCKEKYAEAIEQHIKNLKIQSEQQIYCRIMDARLKLQSTESFTKMAKESPIFADRFRTVDSPDEYYIVVAFLDLFEFLFRLNKRDMIDTEIWSRWKGLAETIMTIPKFKTVWDKTKDVHASEFRDFIDSLDTIS
jgi:hypothetical protein